MKHECTPGLSTTFFPLSPISSLAGRGRSWQRYWRQPGQYQRVNDPQTMYRPWQQTSLCLARVMLVLSSTGIQVCLQIRSYENYQFNSLQSTDVGFQCFFILLMQTFNQSFPYQLMYIGNLLFISCTCTALVTFISHDVMARYTP